MGEAYAKYSIEPGFRDWKASFAGTCFKRSRLDKLAVEHSRAGFSLDDSDEGKDAAISESGLSLSRGNWFSHEELGECE